MDLHDLGAWDAAVVGGGPAGCATALALRAHAPTLRVALLEASTYDRPRLGETLPPLARQLLEHLGVWDAFVAQGHRQVHGTAAAWGSAVPRGHDYFFGMQGSGWHLDRAAFDAMLAAQAERQGVTVLRRTRVRGAERDGGERDDGAGRRGAERGGWQLDLGGGRRLHARFVVDATGPSASVARLAGARFAALDRLTGYGRLFDEPAAAGSAPGGAAGPGGGRAAAPRDPRVLVEAFADGFWYTAGLPGGRRVAVCLTDADVARRLRLTDAAGWERALAATTHVRQVLQEARSAGPLLVRPAQSRLLQPAAGDGWLAVGDAASLFEPLSAQGIVKALRSGIFAAYAAGDLLARGDARGMDRYARLIPDEFAGYTQARARIYAEERRWPQSEFWRRRTAA
jgi:flavin-dependent dehydrogenase